MTMFSARRPSIAAAMAVLTAALLTTAVTTGPAVAAARSATAATAARPGTGTVLQGSGFSRYGSPAAFTAVLFPATPMAGQPVATGTVTFFNGAKVLGTAPVGTAGTATFTTTVLTPGLHSITATYNGDAFYTGSTSDPLTQEVAAPTLFTSSPALSGVVGSPLTFLVTSSGFPAPLLKAAGNLDGLKLTDHGDGAATLAGTPMIAGTFAFSISAGSLVNTVTTQFLTLTVTPAPLLVTTNVLPAAFIGQAYSATLARQGGTPTFTWSLASGQLPKGLTLNASTGVVSGTPTASGTSAFTVNVTDSTSPTKRTATKALSVTSNAVVPAVYAANGANNSVTSYPLGTGNLSPATRLTGTAQGLNAPDGLVLNGAGRLFVADSGADAITEYDRGAAKPTVSIAGANTGLAGPAGLTLDGAGKIYVTNRTANTVTIYAAGASGNATPLFTIGGPDTGLSSPAAVAVDGQGRIWVANASANSITAYGVGTKGDTKPVARIAGSATGLNFPQGLALDAGGNLLAANTFGESVTAYPISFIGIVTDPNVFPVRTISGSSTGLSFPDGIDVDASGRIYVANQFDNEITTYPAAANGNAVPTMTIAGGKTGLAGPGAIAITPPLSVLTHAVPAGRAGRAYRAVLQAGQGTSPYVWSLARGWLPPGVWLQRDGTIAGTPRRGGRWTAVVRVTDASRPHAVAIQSLRFVVAGR